MSATEVQALREQLDHYNEWFAQINQLVGADPGEPAVNSVTDFVHKARLDREVLEHIRDENEVNKKNIFKFATEKSELSQYLSQVCQERDDYKKQTEELLNRRDKLLEERQEFRDWVDRNQAEIDRLRLVIDGETSDDESDEETTEVREAPVGFLPADIVWEVLGESKYHDELNRRLFPECFTDDEESESDEE